MKKMSIAIAGFILVTAFSACSDSGTGTTTTDNTSTTSGDSSHANNSMTGGTNTNTATTPTTTSTTKMPLSKDDSTFVMKAAMGGMMEVDGGNLAQTNAASDRVKAFGQMMVTDHSKANAELASLASSRGLMVPTEVSPDMKKHEDAMKKMTGKSFDSHYMGMMLTDHKKDIADFEKAAKSSDPDIKTFAEKTLPVLRTHLDSAQAISKAKM